MKRIGSFAVCALFVVGMCQKPAVADVVDIYDGLGFDFGPLNTFFTGQGYTVNQLSSTFSSLAGANFVILSEPGTLSLSAGQLSTIDSYVDGGGRLLINSEWYPGFTSDITSTNTILTSLGSSIVNADTASEPGYHDTSDIVVSPFTAGVTDVNYADTSSLSGGTALVFGNPVTDDGQEFIAYQGIGSGFVFVIADSDTADNINSTTTNNNGVLYCDFGGLTCAATPSTVPEPGSIGLLFTAIAGAGLVLRKQLRGRRSV